MQATPWGHDIRQCKKKGRRKGLYIEAMDWKAARWTAVMPIRVGSVKFAASNGVGPRL
jgi:hypothetical protein